MSVSRVSTHVAEMVEKAINEYASEETVHWDVGPLFSPQSPPVYYVSIIMPTAILGQFVHAGIGVQEAHAITQDGMNETIRKTIDQLQSARSAQLQQDLGQAEQIQQTSELIRAR